MVDITDIGLFDGSDNDDEKYLNGQSIVYGSRDTEIIFEIDIPPEHTIFSICKYISTGSSKGRIINAMDYNAPIGHHAGKSGEAYYYNRWITIERNNFGNSWILSSSSPDMYRANGIDLTTNPWDSSFSYTTRLGINQGQYSGERSDFAWYT